MRWSKSIVAVILFYLLYGLYLSHYNLQIIPSGLTTHELEGYHDYKGVLNVHATSSIDSTTFQDIIQAGQDADLDFLIVTELNNFNLNPKPTDGYYNNLLLLWGGEYSYLNSRLLNLGLTEDRDLSGPGQAQVFLADTLSQTSRSPQQGFFILAHPLKPKYNWIGEYPIGLDGLEIINLKSIWQNGWLRSRFSFLWSLFIFPFNDRLALLRLFLDPIDEVRLWDELSSKRHTIGMVGTGAGSPFHLTNSLNFHYPSYKTLFSLVSHHLLLHTELTGDAKTDQTKILSALRQGQFYLSLDILADPRGFYAQIVNSKGDIFPMGSLMSWSQDLELEIHLPRRPQVAFEVEVYKDGDKIFQANSQNTRIPLPSAGVYRVKVRVIPTLPLPDGKKWIPWIYTNPFFVHRS